MSEDSNEPRFTLDEAQRLLLTRECRVHGHDLEITTNMDGEVLALLCGRCGARWDTTPVRQ